ncbi:MAG: precorrin-8X methylmutase [Aestuariivita sp.]|nr:precorrin-8X methylmutase [Aestuariivita sp.]
MPYSYETNGEVIYKKSFATIRAEADLSRFSTHEEQIAVRMIHASGQVGLAHDIRFSVGFVNASVQTLKSGGAILCDTRMVSEGITQSRLPANNDIVCTLNDPRVPNLAMQMQNTRSAAGLELWEEHLNGALVAIGNAPTALFHLLNMLEDSSCPRPGAIIGCPVGFVGAVESKQALWQNQPVPCCTVVGRIGGSAITAAAINAVASRQE